MSYVTVCHISFFLVISFHCRFYFYIIKRIFKINEKYKLESYLGRMTSKLNFVCGLPEVA